MKKTIILCLISFCFSFSSSAQLNYVYNKRLNEVFDSVCNQLNIKGATASIVVPNEGVWERAWGVSHNNVPITTDMFMGLGSNTKTYTAVALLKLQEQGKLSLDDTVGTWVQHPNIPGNITVRQLLNHTSGLYSFTDNPDMNYYIGNDYTKVWPIDTTLNLVKAPLAQPGGSWNYCNTNFTVAGLIIRSITGKSVHQSLRDLILTPSGLDKTFLYPQETPTGTIPHAWSNVLNTSGNYLEDMIATHGYSHNAFLSLASSAGGYMATAKDNAYFWDKLMNGQMLNSSSMNELQTTVPTGAGGQGYGLGIFTLAKFNNRPVVSHGGTGFGFINDNIHDKTSGVSITVLTNQDSINNNMLQYIVIAALHKVTIQYTDVNHLAYAKNDIKVYPNPVSNQLHISVEEQNAAALIHDITGKTVLNQTLNKGENTISTHAMSNGLYMLTVLHEGQPMYRQKIQVVK